jgi:hypothetical protein
LSTVMAGMTGPPGLVAKRGMPSHGAEPRVLCPQA